MHPTPSRKRESQHPTATFPNQADNNMILKDKNAARPKHAEKKGLKASFLRECRHEQINNLNLLIFYQLKQ
jgi:predicted ATP-grasp superfamily ATP-dependent carboligase